MSSEPRVVRSRQDAMEEAIRHYARRGFRLVNTYGWTATMERGHPVNHLLHFFIGLLTLAGWWIVWIFLIFFNRHKVILVSVDEYLNVHVERP